MGATRVTLNFDSSEGRKYVTENGNNHYESQEEMLEHMADPRYKQDEAYRAKVQEMIGNSDPKVLGVGSREESDYDINSEDVAIIREQTQQLFGNPLYKTSAIYRRGVHQQLSDPAVDAALKPFLNPHGTRGTTRVQLHGEETGSTAPTPPPNTSDSNQ